MLQRSSTTMSNEQRYLEQIMLCSKRLLVLLADYENTSGDLDFAPYGTYKTLEALEEQAASRIADIDEKTGHISLGEYAHANR